MEVLQKESHFSTSSALPNIEIQDKDDLTILSCALNGKAAFFITGDKELLGLNKDRGYGNRFSQNVLGETKGPINR
jgi:predicted nucleic acid-binding protein